MKTLKLLDSLQQTLMESKLRLLRMGAWQIHKARLYLNPCYPEESIFEDHCDRLNSDPEYKAWWDEEIKKLA